MHVDASQVIPILMHAYRWPYGEPRATIPGVEADDYAPSMLFLDTARRMVLPEAKPAGHEAFFRNLGRLHHEQHYEPVDTDNADAGHLLVLDGTEYASSLLLSPDVLHALAKTLNSESLLVGIPTRGQMLVFPHNETTDRCNAFMQRVAREYIADPVGRLSPATFFVSDGRYRRVLYRVCGDAEMVFEREQGCLLGVMHKLTQLPYLAFVLIASADDAYAPEHEQALLSALPELPSALYQKASRYWETAFMSSVQRVMSMEQHEIDGYLDVVWDLEAQGPSQKAAQEYRNALYGLCVAIADATPGLQRDASGRAKHSANRQQVLRVFREACRIR